METIYTLGGPCFVTVAFHGYLSLIKLVNNSYELTSENMPSDMCAQRWFRSACTFVQSDQNIHWEHFGRARMQSFFRQVTNTLIRHDNAQAALSLHDRKCQKAPFFTWWITYFSNFIKTIKSRSKWPGFVLGDLGWSQDMGLTNTSHQGWIKQT